MARHKRGRIAVITAAVAVAAAVVAGEFTARQMIEGQIATALRPWLGGPLSVSIGAAPALADLVKGSIGTVSVTGATVRTCKLGDVGVGISFNGVTRHGGNVYVSDSRACLVITPGAIASLLAQRNPQLGTASIRPDGADGTLAIAVGPGGLLTVDERPSLTGDALRFTPVGGSVGPGPIVRATFTVALPRLPMNLAAQAVRVDQAGIVLTAGGGAATFGPGHRAPVVGECQ
jgi:hypothetical protein